MLSIDKVSPLRTQKHFLVRKTISTDSCRLIETITRASLEQARGRSWSKIQPCKWKHKSSRFFRRSMLIYKIKRLNLIASWWKKQANWLKWPRVGNSLRKSYMNWKVSMSSPSTSLRMPTHVLKSRLNLSTSYTTNTRYLKSAGFPNRRPWSKRLTEHWSYRLRETKSWSSMFSSKERNQSWQSV